MGVEKVIQIGNTNSFEVKHHDGMKYVTTAEHNAGVIVCELETFLDDVPAGLAFLADALEKITTTRTGELDQWQAKGVLGLVRGLQALASNVEYDLRTSLSVLKTFADTKGHE